jgi:hypothetical protein
MRATRRSPFALLEGRTCAWQGRGRRRCAPAGRHNAAVPGPALRRAGGRHRHGAQGRHPRRRAGARGRCAGRRRWSCGR